MYVGIKICDFRWIAYLLWRTNYWSAHKYIIIILMVTAKATAKHDNLHTQHKTWLPPHTTWRARMQITYRLRSRSREVERLLSLRSRDVERLLSRDVERLLSRERERRRSRDPDRRLSRDFGAGDGDFERLRERTVHHGSKKEKERNFIIVYREKTRCNRKVHTNEWVCGT